MQPRRHGDTENAKEEELTTEITEGTEKTPRKQKEV
jgi:hypothetical protein